MKKVLFIVPSRALSGGIFVVRQHAKLLAQRGYDVTVSYLHRSELDGSCALSEILPAREIFHCDLNADDIFDCAIATWWETAYFLSEVNAKSYFYLVQGFEERLYPANSPWPLLVQRTYQAGFNFIAINSGLQHYLLRRFAQKAAVVPPGIDLGDYECEPRLPPTSGNLRVLVEGSPFADHKRVGLAFEVLSQFSDVEIVYVSPEGKPSEGWKVDHFFEQIPNSQIPSVCKSCDLILKLSTDETFSLPVLESFASGATAITSQFYGGSDYIRDGENAIVVPVDDVGAATRALKRLQADRSLLGSLKDAARKTASQYTWSGASSKMLGALLEGFALGPPECAPLKGCLLPFQAAHAMRLELTQANQDIDQFREENTALSTLLGQAHSDLVEARKEITQLRESRSYRLGNSLAKLFHRAMLFRVGGR